jgi:hypothetical protein
VFDNHVKQLAKIIIFHIALVLWEVDEVITVFN